MGKVVDTESIVIGVQGLGVADSRMLPLPLGGHPGHRGMLWRNG